MESVQRVLHVEKKARQSKNVKSFNITETPTLFRRLLIQYNFYGEIDQEKSNNPILTNTNLSTKVPTQSTGSQKKTINYTYFEDNTDRLNKEYRKAIRTGHKDLLNAVSNA
jgi:hypothetical protein